MHDQRIALTAVVMLLWANAICVGQEGAAVNWESYKNVEFEFGESLLRVGSDYQMYAFAADAPTSWASTYAGPEITEITSPITAGYSSSQTSSPRATASAITGWLLEKDDASGVATLSNAAAGSTAIVDKFDPSATAMSWAAQSTSLEVGEEISQGVIEWSPGILVGASGGSFISSQDRVSIHDPIVVWTRDLATDLVEPTTLFELNAEFDSKTEIHWNEVRMLQLGVDGDPELVVVPNDGPFLDAGTGGSGAFRLRLDSNLLPAAQRGTLSVEFKDGVVTESSATGVFSDLAPRPNAVDVGSLPEVGAPAIIDRLVIDNDEVDNGRFALNVNAGQGRVITDVAACSDGVHISVGAAVDTIQTFTLNPLQRLAVGDVATDGSFSAAPGPCLGGVREDADLLFGNSYSAAPHASLQAESGANPIDRFLRLHPLKQPQAMLFHRGDNTSPAETRRWTATFDARLTGLPLRQPTDPIVGVPVEPVEPIDEVGPRPTINDAEVDQIDTPSRRDGGLTTGVVQAAEGIVQPELNSELLNVETPTFAVGLLDIGTHNVSSAGDVERQHDASLFQDTAGFVVTVSRLGNASVVRLLSSGQILATGKIPAFDRSLDVVSNAWQRFQLDLEQHHAGIAVQLDLVGEEGDDAHNVLDAMIPKERLSDHGYRLALGSRLLEDHMAHDFDNLIVTFQQTGDVAWDGKIDRHDVLVLSQAIAARLPEPIFDIDLNGRLTVADLEQLEDMIPRKRPGDANLDGFVTFPDFLILAAHFGESTGLWTRGDFDSDGLVDFPDFLLLASNFQSVREQHPQTIPEPCSRAILLLGLSMLASRVRRRRAVGGLAQAHGGPLAVAPMVPDFEIR